METFIIDVIKTLGITGFALWIMWKMYEHSSERFKEKDDIFIRELKEREQNARDIEREVRTSIMSQLADNTRVLERVVKHLDKQHDK